MSSSVACADCNKVFTHRKNLYQHQRNIHNTAPDLLEYPKNFTCDACGISFTYIQNLYRHRKKFHRSRTSASEKHECSSCCESFRTQHSYLRHLEIAHNEKSESYNFTSKREFELWKSEEEEKCKSLFSTRSCYRVFNNHARRTNFLCHRYGEFKSKSMGRRCLKMRGSTREGNFCTARMEVTEFQTGEVRVLYFPKHKFHCDSVNYGIKKDDCQSVWLTVAEDSTVEIEKIVTLRKGRLKLSDIREVHNSARLLDTNLVLSTRLNGSLSYVVRSEYDPELSYRVSATGNPCYSGIPAKRCNLICNACDICIHQYKCSCDDWADYGGLMCKHIHLVGLSRNESLLNLQQDVKLSTENTWYPIQQIDDSIFVEIELNEDDVNEDKKKIDFSTVETVTPTKSFSPLSSNRGEAVDLTIFKSIMSLGKNASVSNLHPFIISRINKTAQKYLSLLETLVASKKFDPEQ